MVGKGTRLCMPGSGYNLTERKETDVPKAVKLCKTSVQMPQDSLAQNSAGFAEVAHPPWLLNKNETSFQRQKSLGDMP